MAVRKFCAHWNGCTKAPACDHQWYIDIRFKGKDYRIPVNEFAAPRMRPDELHLVTSKQEARTRWEPQARAELHAGRDPRLPPAPITPSVAAGVMTLASF